MNDMTPGLPATTSAFTLVPRTLEEAMRFAKLISQSELVPKDFAGKEANCLVAMQWGMELGMQPLQAIQNIAVINGRPSMWGDAVIALVRSSPLCEWIKEEVSAESATCTTKRRGDPSEHSRTFSMEDAAKAGLKGKQGPWASYPKRMLQMRARAWCLRDTYPDVLRGMAIAEEVMDTPPTKDVTAQGSHTTAEVQMPREKAPEKAAEPAKAETPPAVAAAEPARDGELLPRAEKGETSPPAKASQISLIRTKAKQATITEEEIAKRFNLEGDDPLAGITTAQGNAILNFIRNPS